MSRSVQIHDLVQINLGDQGTTYEIKQIEGLYIYIGLADSEELSLIYPNEQGQWLIYGAESLSYSIQFLPEPPSTILGTGYLDKLMLSKLDDESLRIACSLSPKFEGLCEDVWRDKIYQIDSTLNEYKDPNQSYEDWYQIVKNQSNDIDSILYGGNIDLLRWYISKGHPPDRMMIYRAYEIKQLPIIKWLIKNYPEILYPGLDQSLFRQGLLLDKDIEFLDLLVDTGYKPNQKSIVQAITDEYHEGKNDILNWVKKRNIRLNAEYISQEFEDLIRTGDLEALKFIYQEFGIYPGESFQADIAGTEGHLDILKWLSEFDIYPAYYIVNIVRQKGYRRVFDWLKEKGIVPAYGEF